MLAVVPLLWGVPLRWPFAGSWNSRVGAWHLLPGLVASACAHGGSRTNACSQSSCSWSPGVWEHAQGKKPRWWSHPSPHTPLITAPWRCGAQAPPRHTLGCRSLVCSGSSVQPTAFSLGLISEASSSVPGSPCTDIGMCQTGEHRGLLGSVLLAAVLSLQLLFHPADVPTGEETPLGAETFPPWGAGSVQIPSFSFSFCPTWLQGGFLVSLEV